MSQGIFVSYRRTDTASATGRLCDHLRLNGFDTPGDLFVDIDDVPPGADFRVVIQETLQRCDLVIVVIGRSWLTATDARGSRRLDSPSDTHRLEVAAALRSDGVVVPVRVEGASHPMVEDLPDDLSDLAYRNSWELTEHRFRADVAELAKHLRELRLSVQASRHAARSAAEQRERQAQAQAAEAANRREALARTRQAQVDREQRESEARLRKEKAEASLYESMQEKNESAPSGPASWNDKLSRFWNDNKSDIFIYWIPGICLFFAVASSIGAVTDDKPDKLSDVIAGVGFFLIVGAGFLWYGLSRRS